MPKHDPSCTQCGGPMHGFDGCSGSTVCSDCYRQNVLGSRARSQPATKPVKFTMQDKDLQAQLQRMITQLERSVDYVGETPIRHALSEHIVTMRKLVRDGVTELR